MNIDNLHTKNWQLGLNTTNVVVDIDDINQCVKTILLTRKGEDPLRPHFGCGLADYIDKPALASLPKMKKEILEAVAAYEPRVSITKIEHFSINE